MYKEIEQCQKVLEHFLNIPINCPDQIIKEFSLLDYAELGYSEEGHPFVYIEGSRKNKLLLVAHADTVWQGQDVNQDIGFKDGVYFSKNGLTGIGGDDRAGIALLWLFKDLGHSILVVSSEEKGIRCSRNMPQEFLDRLNDNHQFFIEFDKPGEQEFKTCFSGSFEFENFLQTNLGYKYAGPSSFTDLCFLCQKVCGANISVGYFDLHTKNQTVKFKIWYQTYLDFKKFLNQTFQKFTINYQENLDLLEENIAKCNESNLLNHMQAIKSVYVKLIGETEINKKHE